MVSEVWSDEDLVELHFVRAKEIDALVDQTILPEKQRYSDELHQGFTLRYPELVLEIVTGNHYPVKPLTFETTNNTLPRAVIDGLREELRQIVFDDEKPSLADEWRNRAECDNLESADFPMTALHLITATISRLKDFRADEKYWRNSKGLPPSLLSSDPKTLDHDAGTVDSILEILGKTPEQICALVPSEFKVLHIEKVIRRDLTREFNSQTHQIRAQLSSFSSAHLRKNIPIEQRSRLDTKKDMINHLLTPHLTFHGTQRHVIPSIVRNGFLLPGDLNPLDNTPNAIRCGSTYGRGIYSSPSAHFALSYSSNAASRTLPSLYDGLKLLVCATHMGVAARVSGLDNLRARDRPLEGATSHVGLSGMEYIVFHRAHILPCYVIHLDWGAHHGDYFAALPANPWTWVQRQRARNTHPRLSAQVLSPGDRQRAKEARGARAAKYLGFGFGPACGAALVVEEVGEVSEDEEDYGEFQRERVEEVRVAGGEGQGEGFWEWRDDGGVEEVVGGEGDEYTEARKARSLVYKVQWAEKMRRAKEKKERRKAEGRP
ncbi:hypothetical protein G7Y79_00037g073410 [Physcia stellaris]|nr:hypothetical protein G7Y79_00037g073410 [Physcia stellaris]